MTRTPGVRRLLTDPDRFFATRRRNPRPLRATAAVLAVGLLATVLAAQVLPAFPNPFPWAPAGALAAAVGVGTVVVAWVGNAAVLHLASAPVANDGEFRTTLTLTGWGFLPTGGSFAAIMAAVAVSTNLGQRIATATLADLVNMPSVRVTAALVVVFSVWHAFLMFFAVEYGRGVPGRWAAAVTATPFLVVGALVAAAL